MEEVELTIAEVQWAIETARESFARWKSQKGYYNNRLNSHFKGKIGELATEKFLMNKSLKLDSHFRFPDRENLADIVIKIKGYKRIVRVEIKTWSANYWKELGRCIAVDQLSDLKKKSDVIIWCLTNIQEIPKTPAITKLFLYGWSTMTDVENAPIRLTGMENMRKVKNFQLPEKGLREMNTFLSNVLNLTYSN